MVARRFRDTMESDHSLQIEEDTMVTVIWIATLISVAGAIELLARSAATEETIVTARIDETS